MNNYLLSIVAPIKNENKYIEKLISTFLEIDDERVELLLSDNYSDDGTFEKIKSKKIPNVHVFRPDKDLTPFENHKYAINKSSGEFIFPLGGDDYLSPTCVKLILEKIKPGKIIIPIVRTFDDQSGETILISNTKQEIELLFNENHNFDIKKYLHRINYDELIFNVCEKKLLKHLLLIRPNTVETFATWSNIFLFSGIHLSQVEFIDCVLLNKRYNKVYDKSTFSIDQKYNETSIYRKSINAIYNTYVFYSTKRQLLQSIHLSFLNRYAVGHYDKGNPDIRIKKFLVFSPVLMILISPVIFIKNFLKKFFV